LAAAADIFKNLLNAFLVNNTHAFAGHAQTDKTLLGFNPETVLMQIRQKTATSAVFCV